MAARNTINCRRCAIFYDATRHNHKCPLCSSIKQNTLPLEELVDRQPRNGESVTVVTLANYLCVLHNSHHCLSGTKLACVSFPLPEVQERPKMHNMWFTRSFKPEIAALENTAVGYIDDWKITVEQKPLARNVMRSPVPVDTETNPHLFSLEALQEEIAKFDEMTQTSEVRQALSAANFDSCTFLAASLSMNRTVAESWENSVHAPYGGRFAACQEAYLVLKWIPGMPLLTATNPMPLAPWKTVARHGYEWLRVYYPATEKELIAHDERCMRAAENIVGAEIPKETRHYSLV